MFPKRNWAWLAILALLAPGVSAERPGQEPDLSRLALEWARGEFRSPLLCDFGGTPVRGLRRLLISPGPRKAHPPVVRIQLFGLDAPNASRCFDELGGEQLDIVGSVLASHRSRSRPDLAGRQFREALKREHGFTYQIEAGSLELRSLDGGETRELDLAGGSLRLTLVHPGSDAARVLSDLAAPRKLTLVLESADGEQLAFPLAQSGAR